MLDLDNSEAREHVSGISDGNGMIRIKSAASGQVTITFVLTQPPAGHTSVAGCFNDWKPGSHRLAKRSNGTWSAAVRVPAGSTVCFRYLATDGVWFDDPDPELARDDRGQLLTV